MPLQGRVLQRIREIEEGYCSQGRPAAPRTVMLTGVRQSRRAPTLHCGSLHGFLHSRLATLHCRQHVLACDAV